MPNVSIQKSPFIISDKIDEMVIVIHVNSGAYYSLTEAGSALWAKIEAGEESFSDLELGLLKALVDEEILSPNDGLSSVSVAPIAEVAMKFTDMEGLMMGDPIHEVDEQGWPALKDKAN